MIGWLNGFFGTRPIVSILDILLVWFIVYRLIIYAKQTRALNLLQGIGLIIFAKFISRSIGLQTIDWLLGQILSWGVVAIIILFQPSIHQNKRSVILR